ncbi:MAG: M14 family metallopeptidase [Cyclobacteriaceae bacterium]|nr:M14 family metallopeptidase [Cyclobacteriaceae bacterium]
MKTIFTRIIFLLLLTIFHFANAQVPKPEDVYGFKVGADYELADYNQILDYLGQLAEASPRVIKTEIGKSVLGKPMLLLFISSEENLAKLEEYRQISESMARAKIDEATAIQYSKEGKAVIWIDGGMHASEKAHGQMTSELAWRVATEESDEMKKIRDNVIFVLMPVMNPDGLDIVVDWYRQQLGTPFETTNPPWLYHHYVGHDNNRDWFMNNMPETYHVNEELYNKWYPQIVYNQHQTGPSWSRIFVPPFSDPVNPSIHPGVTTGTNLIGTAMTNRFAMKNMSGVVSHLQYSMWWNGGGRTTPYFHNMIGILTETSHATPTPRFYPPDSIPKYIGHSRGNVTVDGTKIFYPYPWKGGESHFRDAVDYMITGSMGVLDYAADRKEELLYNIYKMGKDAVNGTILDSCYAYVIPTTTWDEGEAINLVNILRGGGIEVHQASKEFKVGDKKYKEGSFIIYAEQAFRPYLTDLMEKQNYPNKEEYPGGPPVPPYDLAGWTLPMQMGVAVDKISDPFEVKTQEITGRSSITPGKVKKANYGYILSGKNNAAYNVINKLLASGVSIYRITEASGEISQGDFIIAGAHDQVTELATEHGVDFTGINEAPSISKQEMHKPKVGIYKSWVPNMDEGWTRWLLTEYNFDWDTLHDSDIRTRDLSQFDAIIIPNQSTEQILNGHRKGFMPEEYTGGMGLEGSLMIKQYVEKGGTLITFDRASDFVIDQFGLPVKNPVKGLSDKQFFIPGSLIRTDIDTSNPLAFGMQEQVAASFNRSRAFEILVKENVGEGGNEKTVKVGARPDVTTVANYAKEDLLMSGWALNEKKSIGGKGALMRVGYGNGNVILFGFRPQFRGQPRVTYKLVFNSIYAGATVEEIEK